MALARAIICQPRLILLDEPLGALDVELRRQMQGFLKSIQREIKTTFLFVTHDQEEAITMADRICVMQAGRIQQIGTPHEVYYRPSCEFVARFFGENNLVPGTLGPTRGACRAIETRARPVRLLVEASRHCGCAGRQRRPSRPSGPRPCIVPAVDGRQTASPARSPTSPLPARRPIASVDRRQAMPRSASGCAAAEPRRRQRARAGRDGEARLRRRDECHLVPA